VKLDQIQNYKLNAMVSDNAKDLNIDSDFLYELLKSVIDAKNTDQRVNRLSRLVNVLGNKNLVASAQAAVDSFNVIKV